MASPSHEPDPAGGPDPDSSSPSLPPPSPDTEGATPEKTDEQDSAQATARLMLRRQVYRKIFLIQVGTLGFILALVALGLVVSTHLGALPFSLAAGCLGGTISMFRRLRVEPDALIKRLADDWILVALPLTYGAVMAGLAYLLFMSGILSGDGGKGLFTSNLFPNFTDPEIPQGESLSVHIILSIRPASVQDFGKLMVWTFLTGYSEKFIVGILRALEDKK